jgi:hypothetical protein
VITGSDSYAGLFHLEFDIKEKSYLAYANLSGKPRTVKLPGSNYYHPAYPIREPGSRLNLEPYQTVCFHCYTRNENRAYLLGASGHIFPGAQIDRLVIDGDQALLDLHPDSSPETEVCLALPREMGGLTVNGVYFSAEPGDGLNLVRVK